MIRKEGSEYKIYSENGKHLGTYPSREAAEKRLAEIEMFKHMKKKQLGEK